MAKIRKMTGQQVADMVAQGSFGENGRELAMNMQAKGALTYKAKRPNLPENTPDPIVELFNQAWDLIDRYAFTLAENNLNVSFSVREKKTKPVDETPAEQPAAGAEPATEPVAGEPAAAGQDDPEDDPF